MSVPTLEYIIAFFAGGLATVMVTAFELSGFPILSRLAALFPIVTWVSYLFIGYLDSAETVSKSAHFVMLGTLVAWMPYIFIIYYFSPRIGVGRSIAFAIAVFLFLAFIFSAVYNKWA
ncbi:MAG: hypothetical protein KGH56_03745 [Patescibacteria group bacterium]|nr:hypothetical protein [Patescibacteria group bacterium]